MTPLQDATVMENQSSVMICELSKPGIDVQWTRAGEPVKPSENVKITAAGVLHTLSIEKTTLEDEAEYSLSVGELTTRAELLVDGESSRVMSSLNSLNFLFIRTTISLW